MFLPVADSGYERLKERGLQFILHIAPPLSLPTTGDRQRGHKQTVLR